MSTWDLLSLIIENLSRRKARVALTAIGVVIGTAAVVLLVSLGVGLQQNAEQQLGSIGDLTKISVWPMYDFGEGGGGGGGPVAINEEPQVTPLTSQSIADIQAIPGVSVVIPQDPFYFGTILNVGQLEGYSQLLGIGVDNLSQLGVTAREGTLDLAPGTVIVGASVNQSFYNPRPRPGQGMDGPPELLDETLKITLIKWASDGTETRKTIRVKIVGVINEMRDEPDWSIYMPMSDMESYLTWANGKRPNREKDGYATLIVRVGDVEDVLDVTQRITDLGYQAYTPQSFVQGITGFYTVLQVVFGGVGAIALLVAAIGIANTMAMAILERTREIGLMKAVGATNRHVLSVFLGEAAGIGFIGGVGGVAIGWALGQVVNVLALAYFAGQSVETGAPPPTVAVSTPTWLPLFSVVFATLIGLLSGLYPALSAATLEPVKALKYE
ncbi:MAG: ABC transporter permease [Chloroflexi bacterium]|nr:ABC transporter permease [Chloroflexota bacterium]